MSGRKEPDEAKERIDLLKEILSELEALTEEELLIILNGVVKIKREIPDDGD
jgi:hypothetical protein